MSPMDEAERTIKALRIRNAHLQQIVDDMPARDPLRDTMKYEPGYRDAVEQRFYEYYGWRVRNRGADWMHVVVFLLGLAGGFMLGTIAGWMA